MGGDLGHGNIGKVDPSLAAFTTILGERDPKDAYDPNMLAGLARYMASPPDHLSDGADPEENLYVPAGYTYLGQFVDHDLTLDTTSTLNLGDLSATGGPIHEPTNLRSPRFDLDCIYGNGPADQPYMYAAVDDPANGVWSGATLVIGPADLARAHNGTGVNGAGVLSNWTFSRAIIGDKRNDENSIVNQIQQLFIRFHNKVVNQKAQTDAKLREADLFTQARDTVRWTYQRILVDDFLPRIVDPAVLSNFLTTKHYELYPDDARQLRRNLPREFVAAVYRFGHSGVRQGYRLNGQSGPLEAGGGKILSIFKNPDNDPEHSLIGFDPLPPSHLIDDWARFFPLDDALAAGERRLSNDEWSLDVSDNGATGGEGKVRLQYAYKIDPSLVDPLANLPAKIATQDDVQPDTLRHQAPRLEGQQPDMPWGPSLALLNLLRGNRYRLRSGQSFEPLVGATPLDRKYLCVRIMTEVGNDKQYKFQRIKDLPGLDGQPLGERLELDTPLWFYILAEAQRPLVDLWIEGGQKPLTENQLKGLDDQGKAIVLPENPDATDIQKALLATRAAGTQLGPVGGRLVTEVFYGLLESDPDSIFGDRSKGWQLPFGGGAASMGRLVSWLRT